MSSSPVFPESDLIPIIKPQIKRSRKGLKRPLSNGESQTEYAQKTYKGALCEDSDDEEMTRLKGGYTVVKGTVSKEHQEMFFQASEFWKEHANDPLTVLIEFTSLISLRIGKIRERYDKNENSRVTKISQKTIMYPYVDAFSRILSDQSAMFEFLALPQKKQNAIIKAAHHVLATMCDFVYEA